MGEYSLYRLKNVYKEMKDADEDRFYELDYEEEKWGAWTSGVNLVSQVACIIILSFGYSLKYIESGKSRYFLFACIIFILCYFYDIYLSVRYVKAIQAAHPEKKVIQLQANLRNSGWKAVMKQKRNYIQKCI